MEDYYNMKETISTASEMQMDFDVITAGTSTKLKFLDENGDVTDSHKFMSMLIKGRGLHLANMTLMDVRKRLANGDYVPINTDPNRHSIETVCFNPKNIKYALYKKNYSLDINSCYWNTANNKGIISEKLYKYGYTKNKEWKDARNISIGALGTAVRVEKYRNGKLVERTPFTPRPTNVCRLDIIDHVWNVCINDIRNQLGKNFLMFLTDCFFVNASVVDKVADLLELNGYQTKRAEVIFTGVKSMGAGTYKVTWQTADKEKSHFFDESNIQ